MERIKLFILTLALCITVTAFGQQKKITLSNTRITVKDALESVKKQTGISYWFDANDLDAKRVISVNLKDQDLDDALKAILAGQNVRYELKDNYIIISKNKSQTESNPQEKSSKKITGVVIDATSGETLPGVNITVQGTSAGVTTDIDGKFGIEVPSASSILVFSYVGYTNLQVPCNKQSVLKVSLSPDVKKLDEVVVTAMGIVKREKSLTYSAQSVTGDELTRVKDPNMINALAGKTAGVTISKSSAGLGGSVEVNIRGSRSAAGNNQPLYVIDGVPVSNNITEQPATTMGGTNDGANRDSGDGISNLNPDDIESMTILKGPAAAALYGSQAANGVVVITTKKGASGKTQITFNSSTTFDNVISLPKMQNLYGDANQSWGSTSLSTKGYAPGDFFNTGINTINSISLTSGNDAMQTYFSYANTTAKGTVGNNKLQKHNFNFRETAQFFKKLSIDGDVNFVYQRLLNSTTPGGVYMNPLIAVYQFPRGGDLNVYKNNYEIFNPSRNMYVQNWYKFTAPYEVNSSDGIQNPFWILNKTPNTGTRARVLPHLTLKWKFNDDLSVQVRGNADYISDAFQQAYYAGTNTTTCGTNGRLIVFNGTELHTYSDLLLTYNKKINDFAISANAGASIADDKVQSLRLDSYPAPGAELFFANVFTVANMDLNNGYSQQINNHNQTQSLFATAQAGYKDRLFLDMSVRNDWSASLAFTDHKNSGFFYPSVGLTAIISDMVKMPKWWNYAKIRGTVSEVGNSLPLYISNGQNTISSGGKFVQNTIGVAPGTSLKPENTRSLETGFETKFFNSHISVDFTYYKTNTYNQLFTLPAPATSGYSQYYVNAGNIQNEGYEVSLGIVPLTGNKVVWKSHFNFATNKNKVISLEKDLDFFPIGQLGSDNYQMRLVTGGSFGDLYGIDFARDASGKIIYDAAGLPTKNTSFTKIGNTSPTFKLGWDNTLAYKNWSFYFLVDGRFGGRVLSMTEAGNDQVGTSQTTGEARQRGYVMLEGTKITDVEDFYKFVGGRAGVTAYYLYNATNIRLREISLGYSIPKTVLKNMFVKGIDLSLVARNLFFIYKKAPYDPDSQMAVNGSLQGVDVYGVPTTRSMGINVKINF
jgi:TonB-linked SusC/RagA family outer membrane protein